MAYQPPRERKTDHLSQGEKEKQQCKTVYSSAEKNSLAESQRDEKISDCLYKLDILDCIRQQIRYKCTLPALIRKVNVEKLYMNK